MKVVLLAGGIGSRLSEETYLKPKPLVEIGNMPIIWHIMMIYSHHGFNEFIICCGYKGYLIKEYFANYFLHLSDVEIDVSNMANMKLAVLENIVVIWLLMIKFSKFNKTLVDFSP